MSIARLDTAVAADKKTPSAVANSTESQTTPKSEKQPTFDIKEFRVRGNTLLDKLQIELVLYPFLGKGKTIKDIEQARQALESRYRQAGYPTVLVNIPEQNVDNGLIYLYVTEAKIDNLEVTGSNYFSLQRIREEMPSLKEGNVLYLADFQKELTMANSRTPDRLLTPVLKRGRLPGTVAVELKVTDKSPLHGSAEINNQYSANTTKLRAIGTLRYDNLWQKEHSFTLQYQTAPKKPQEVKVVSGVYLARPIQSRNLYVVSAIHSNSNVSTVAGSTVVGKGNIFGVSSIMPIAADATSSHSAKLDLSYKNLIEDSFIGGAISTKSPLKYYSLGGQYTGSFHFEKSSLLVNAGFTIGLGTLNERKIDCNVVDINGNNVPTDQFQCRRDGAKPNFFHLNLGADYSTKLPEDYAVELKLSGQISDTPMISNEQFGAGGATTVRGYYESERFGDDGVIGSLELHSPSIAKMFSEAGREKLNDLYFLLFVDRAWLRTLFPSSGTEARWQLYSAGFGLRMHAWHSIYTELDWAHAYRDSQSAYETSTPDIRAGHNRIHVKIEYEF